MRTTESRKTAALRALREAYDRYLALSAQLRDNHAAAPSRYTSLRSFCDAAVGYREWSRNPRYEPDPFYFVLGDCRRGKPHKRQPEKLAGWHEYGFDAFGRVVVEREYVAFPGQCYEEFFAFADDQVDSTRYSYSPDKPPIRVTRQYLVDGRLACYQTWAPAGQSHHVYAYEQGAIRWFFSLHETFGVRSFGGFGEVTYDGDGEILRIYQLSPDGSRTLEYEAKPKRAGAGTSNAL